MKNIDVDNGGSGEGARGFVGDDGSVRIPVLVIGFTVENKVKAMKQTEQNKAMQQADPAKQKIPAMEKSIAAK